ncbi:SgcJ/EcaC family oxidoreductase [Anaerobacillus sp. MEB173]|uniref:SgcJ/EcaC family oxidoreductase n=1 Tax=Anaerobacillus sp. MEB173 TaxID=3383345 RepID=UPI003F8E1125
MNFSVLEEINSIYEKLIGAWNNRSASGMAELFTGEGELIGFDGSHVIGREDILSHLKPIFENHPTPPFVSKVKSKRILGSDIAILRAIVGMIPHGETELNPELNAHQTLIVAKRDVGWGIELFQNTPAQFHGRPELVEQMTNELKDMI